jgi:hypothetical protein
MTHVTEMYARAFGYIQNKYTHRNTLFFRDKRMLDFVMFSEFLLHTFASSSPESYVCLTIL